MTEKEQALNLMEEGWQEREKLHFEKAEKLINEAKNIFEKLNDWYNVSECLNHLVYSKKLQAIHKNNEGLLLAQESLKILKENNLKDLLGLRAYMTVLANGGNYEMALKVAEEILEKTDKDSIKVDILNHLAEYLLRIGKIPQAKKALMQVEALLPEVWKNEREPHRSIWKSKFYILKALLAYNAKNVLEFEKFILLAEELAKEQSLKTRLVEIANLKSLYEK